MRIISHPVFPHLWCITAPSTYEPGERTMLFEGSLFECIREEQRLIEEYQPEIVITAHGDPVCCN